MSEKADPLKVHAKPPKEILSHWGQVIENFSYSPQTFYTAVEERIRASGIDQLRIGLVEFPEGSLYESKRLYLRVVRKFYTFDICAAPYGEHFIFSTWLGFRFFEGFKGAGNRFLLSIPLVGDLWEREIQPTTFFQHDTAAAFNVILLNAVKAEVAAVSGDCEQVFKLDSPQPCGRKSVR